MSEQIDITRPLYTKRGGVVTEFREIGNANLLTDKEVLFVHRSKDRWIGTETFDGKERIIGWCSDFSYWSDDEESGYDLTNTPPATVAAPQPDMVNHPPHYVQGGIECIDAIKAALTPDEWRGFLKGQILKYTWRERLKGGQEDIGKAGFYLAKLKGGQ